MDKKIENFVKYELLDDGFSDSDNAEKVIKVTKRLVEKFNVPLDSAMAMVEGIVLAIKDEYGA